MKATTLLALLLGSLVPLACAYGPLPDDLRATQQSGLSQVGGYGASGSALSMYLYVPPQLRAKQVPVVVALHGCTQSAAAYQGAGWNTLADERGFLVIYPQKTADNACFAWFDSANTQRGQGEALAVKQMVDWVKARYDVGEVFVTGLSAGGGFTAVMLAAYPDVFSAGAVMAGLPYRCADTKNDAYSCMFGQKPLSAQQWGDLVRSAAPAGSGAPRVAIFHGASDAVVQKVNADELVLQWTNVHGLSSATATESVGTVTRTTWVGKDGVARVQSWSIPKMGHGTAVDPARGCGTAGAFLLDVGLCSTRESARFFGLLEGEEPKPPVDGGTPASDGGTVTPDAGTTPGCGEDAGTPLPPSRPCKETYSNNYLHKVAGRGALCQPLNGHVCAVGSGEDLGLFNLYSSAWVREREPGFYELGRCQ